METRALFNLHNETCGLRMMRGFFPLPFSFKPFGRKVKHVCVREKSLVVVRVAYSRSTLQSLV